MMMARLVSGNPSRFASATTKTLVDQRLCGSFTVLAIHTIFSTITRESLIFLRSGAFLQSTLSITALLSGQLPGIYCGFDSGPVMRAPADSAPESQTDKIWNLKLLNRAAMIWILPTVSKTFFISEITSRLGQYGVSLYFCLIVLIDEYHSIVISQ